MGGRVSRCYLSVLLGSLGARGVPHRLRILAYGVDLMYPTVCGGTLRDRTTVVIIRVPQRGRISARHQQKKA